MTSVPLQVQFDPASARFGAARSQKRLEDDRLLAGKGLFSDDREFPNQAWLVVVRSPHAHAKILKVDLADARKAKGVIAAWSMADLRVDGVGHIPFPPAFKRADGSPMAAPARTPLAGDKGYYVGQPRLAGLARRRGHAQGAPLVWERAPGNVAAEASYGDPELMDGIFKGAAHVTRLELHNQRVIAMAMEPRACIGVFDAGRTTLYTQNQTPTGARELLGAVFKRKPEDFRVVNGDIGGGFGMKTGLTPEDALVCHAARKLGTPVRWRGERSEEFLAAHMGRDQHVTASLALDRDGRILALRTTALANIGAVPVGSSAIIPLQLTPKVQTTVYRVPAVHYRVRAVLTHTMATGAYRGAGRPEANFLMERLMEKAAREMKLDPLELRRRNFIRPSEFPHRTHLGDVYDSGDFARMLDRALDVADWQGYSNRKEESKRRGKLRGRGVSVYLEWTGAIPTETVDIEVAADGTVTVFSGTQAMGQGLETSYSQLVQELFGMESEKIRIVQGDTDLATGVGSVRSRSAVLGGSALVAAGRKMIARGRELAAEVLEAAGSGIEVRGGGVYISDAQR